VFAVFNLSDRPQVATFHESLHHGDYINYFNGEAAEFSDGTRLELERWGFRVFVR
jgi:hypothetical protein